MRRGSTPTNTFDVDIDLTGATVFITYKQKGRTVIEKTGTDITVTSTSLTVELTQAETLALDVGEVEMQIRYVFPNGSADASNIMRATAERILKDGVIEP